MKWKTRLLTLRSPCLGGAGLRHRLRRHCGAGRVAGHGGAVLSWAPSASASTSPHQVKATTLILHRPVRLHRLRCACSTWAARAGHRGACARCGRVTGAFTGSRPHPVLFWVPGGRFLGRHSGLLKITRGLNEMIVSITLNYVATLFMGLLYPVCCGREAYPRPPPCPTPQACRIVPGVRVTWGIVIALIAPLVVHYFLFYTSRAPAAGGGPQQRRGRFNVSRLVVNPFSSWSRAQCGLGGSVELLGTQYRLMSGFARGSGFDGVPWPSSPAQSLATVAVAYFFAVLRTAPPPCRGHRRAHLGHRHDPGAGHRLRRGRIRRDPSAPAAAIRRPASGRQKRGGGVT